MYYLDKVHSPGSRDGQDMWTADISINADKTNNIIAHTGCIEVHAETEHQVRLNSQIIIDALNKYIQNPQPVVTATQKKKDPYQEAMKGVC